MKKITQNPISRLRGLIDEHTRIGNPYGHDRRSEFVRDTGYAGTRDRAGARAAEIKEEIMQIISDGSSGITLSDLQMLVNYATGTREIRALLEARLNYQKSFSTVLVDGLDKFRHGR